MQMPLGSQTLSVLSCFYQSKASKILNKFSITFNSISAYRNNAVQLLKFCFSNNYYSGNQ